MMPKALHEPLVHFLALGGLLFAAFAWLNADEPGDARDADRIVRLTEQDVSWLSEAWTRQWQRPPTEAELQGLVAGFLREHLLALEARQLGLDDNDIIVRRRLAQKMEFLVRDAALLDEPDEAQLRQFHREHAALFQSPARLWFTQIYFNPQRPGEPVEARIAAARAALVRQGPGGDASEFGDATLLEGEMAGAEVASIAAMFGEQFAQAVAELEPSCWSEPIESGYGLHLFRVSRREQPQPADFEQVRQNVLDQWRHQQQQARNHEYMAALLAKYHIVVDDPLKPLVTAGAVAQSLPRQEFGSP